MTKIIFIISTLLSLNAFSALAEKLTCNSNQSSFNCLVCNCYHETRGEPLDGKIAVAKTVLSRIEYAGYPKTACAVVFQPAQFSWTRDRIRNNISATNFADKQALKDCRDVVEKSIDEGANGIIYFYNPRKVAPLWARRATSCGRAGEHIFLVPRGDQCPLTLGANPENYNHQQIKSTPAQRGNR